MVADLPGVTGCFTVALDRVLARPLAPTSHPPLRLPASLLPAPAEPLPASAFSQRGAAQGWLQELGLPQYAACFEDAGFSGEPGGTRVANYCQTHSPASCCMSGSSIDIKT